MAEPPEPEEEGGAGSLQEKVPALEAELDACRRLLAREKKLRLKAQACVVKLRRQVGVTGLGGFGPDPDPLPPASIGHG